MADDIMVTASEFVDGDQTHPIESEQWYIWLNSQNKFRYSDAGGTFTAYKQERSGNLVWYGQKRRDGILRTQYLGKSEDLNKEVLHRSCETLNLPKQQWLNRERKRSTKTKAHENKPTPTEKMIFEREREQRIELEQKLELLSQQYQESLKRCETLEGQIEARKSHIDSETFNQALEVLEDALLMKANAGGAIKVAIRSAITLLKKSDN